MPQHKVEGKVTSGSWDDANRRVIQVMHREGSQDIFLGIGREGDGQRMRVRYDGAEELIEVLKEYAADAKQAFIDMVKSESRRTVERHAEEQGAVKLGETGDA